MFLTMILQRMRFKYQDRAYRYGLIEAGHIGENLYLAATSMGLGACAVGAFMDDDMNALLGVDGVEEAIVYMLALGKPRTTGRREPSITSRSCSPDQPVADLARELGGLGPFGRDHDLGQRVSGGRRSGRSRRRSTRRRVSGSRPATAGG